MTSQFFNGQLRQAEDESELLFQSIQSLKLNAIDDMFEYLCAEDFGTNEATVGYKNYLFGQSLGFSGGGNSTWLSCVQQMGQWYQNNIHTYQTGTDNRAHGSKGWYSCPLLDGAKVADDCSGYVQACLRLFGVNCQSITTSAMQNNWFMELLNQAGFTHFSGIFTKDNLQPGDIICGAGSTHTEIYAGNGRSWGWGSIHDGINGHYPMPGYFCNLNRKGGYIHCWRI